MDKPDDDGEFSSHMLITYDVLICIDFTDEDKDETHTYSEQVWALLIMHQQQMTELVIATIAAASQAIVLATQRKEAVPYHTSILTGMGWVQELLQGHPERIRTELGVHKHIFLVLITELRAVGHTDSKKGVKLEEQLAIFLYMCVTGLTIRHVAERFQRSNETISKYVI